MRVLLLICAVLAYAQDDLVRGKKLYEGFCSLCHGQTGTGGKGPNLAQPILSRAADDEQLVTVIKAGIRGTEMPGFWQLTDREAKQLAAYVRSLGRIEPEKLTGDPARGKALYGSNGCASCHIVRGSGTALGPELSEIGARRSAAYLRDAIVKPGANVPEGFLVVSVATAGRSVRGIRINEDSFSIQLRDAAGRVHSFRKSELAKITREPNASLMPAYKLSPAELEDLIAYLASLRGES
jgi:putative heme-binding domain-containing protein